MEKKMTPMGELILHLNNMLYTAKNAGEIETASSVMACIELAQSLLPKEREQRKFFFDCGRQFQLTGEGTFEQVENEVFTQTYKQ